MILNNALTWHRKNTVFTKDGGGLSKDCDCELAIVLVEELFPFVTKQKINDAGNSDHPIYVSPS